MPFTTWRARQVQRQQKQKALQMLAASGVVRPSDVELRYPTPQTPHLRVNSTDTAVEGQLSPNEPMAQSLSESYPQSASRHTHRPQWVSYDVPPSS